MKPLLRRKMSLDRIHSQSSKCVPGPPCAPSCARVAPESFCVVCSVSGGLRVQQIMRTPAAPLGCVPASAWLLAYQLLVLLVWLKIVLWRSLHVCRRRSGPPRRLSSPSSRSNDPLSLAVCTLLAAGSVASVKTNFPANTSAVTTLLSRSLMYLSLITREESRGNIKSSNRSDP
jgi:hypothetical protein